MRPIQMTALDCSSFTNPRCRPSSVDTFLHRRAIVKAVEALKPQLHGLLLDVGCGQMPYRELLLVPPSRLLRYVGLDMPSDKYSGADVRWDGTRMPLRDKAVDCVIATEVLEHCPEPSTIFGECHRVLRSGGLLFFTVPFFWPLHDTPHDEARHTPFAWKRLLEAAGFRDVRLAALGGWDASLAQMLGLWARRRPMPGPLRRLVSLLAVPIVSLLARLDRAPSEFRENTMMTGLAGTCTKPD